MKTALSYIAVYAAALITGWQAIDSARSLVLFIAAYASLILIAYGVIEFAAWLGAMSDDPGAHVERDARGWAPLHKRILSRFRTRSGERGTP